MKARWDPQLTLWLLKALPQALVFQKAHATALKEDSASSHNMTASKCHSSSQHGLLSTAFNLSQAL